MKKRLFGKMLLTVLASGTIFGVFAAEGDAYAWPSYRSDLDYNTKENIGDIGAPTKFSTDCNGVTGKKAGKWWAFYWGANRDSRVTDETIDSLLKKYDTDFGYLRDTMGWAPDRRAQNGYYSAVYYYGSGTCAGGATTDTTGGWQTNIGDNGYEAVAASLYPLYSFNPKCPYSDRVSQMNAMVHEGIHSMTKAYPGAQNAHWFQEGGNTWIQQEMESRRSQIYSGMGFLNAAAIIAPFIPIESYSGWLLDGSFGGPGAEGVGVYSGSTQLCNWRNLLGGYQYGNLFPTFLGEWVGKGAVRWLYGNASRYLLEAFGTTNGLGDEATRRLIMEYRARSAMLDFKKWSNNLKTLLNDNFGSSAAPEWTPVAVENVPSWTMTPYAVTKDSSGYLIPESRTTPGWSGANIIPLKVASGATEVSATLYPIGKDMSLQICYRATDGVPVYSTPVMGEGTAILRLDKTPQDGYVFAVICNTDYAYTDDIRKNHYDYRLKPETGISGAGSALTKYYNNFVTTYDWSELGSSSSGTVQASSSSNVVQSSSSSAILSSSSVVSGKEAAITVTVTLPIDDDYAGVSFDLDSAKVASTLGISVSQISSLATYFALEPDGTENTTSTANAPGNWFGKDGKVVSYGEDAYIYSEFNYATMRATVGHYPNRVSDGESYAIRQGFRYNGNKVIYTITVNITNSASGGTTKIFSSLNYGLSDSPATHVSLNAVHGNILVNYELERTDNVKVSLYTAYGELIGHVANEKQAAGMHRKQVDLARLGLPQGTYIIKVTTGSYREAKSITTAK